MKIVAHTIVYNEERFVWFALMSVVDFVTQVIVYDTGSTDATEQIIQEAIKLKGEKIKFFQYGPVDKTEFTKARQQMLDQSDGDWILIVDGDEVWWRDSISEMVNLIKTKGKTIEAIAVPFMNALGDLYHFQDPKLGRYQIKGRVGNLTIRAINRRIPGLHLGNPYGSEGFFDDQGREIQRRDPGKIWVLDKPFLHLTHLTRSSAQQKVSKVKHELGRRSSGQFKLPEVFYQPFPQIVSNPLIKRGRGFVLKSLLLSAPRVLKRKILK